MPHVSVCVDGEVAVLVLSRGKVNALDEPTIGELEDRFRELETDEAVRAVIFSGEGKFFSFGFDIPGFLDYTKPDFSRFLTKFTDLYTHLFTYPKPVVAALAGRVMGGALELAMACHYRAATPDSRFSMPEVRLADRRLPLLEAGRRGGPGEDRLRPAPREEGPRGQDGDRRGRPGAQRRLPGRARRRAQARLRHGRHGDGRSRRDPGRPSRKAPPVPLGEGLAGARLSQLAAELPRLRVPRGRT